MLAINPLSDIAFLDWLKHKAKRQPNQYYSYNSVISCLIAQYLKDCGFKDVAVGGLNFGFTENRKHKKVIPMPDSWNNIALNHDKKGTHTFKQAYKRAKELIG